jgi:hypothetical protein
MHGENIVFSYSKSDFLSLPPRSYAFPFLLAQRQPLMTISQISFCRKGKSVGMEFTITEIHRGPFEQLSL